MIFELPVIDELRDSLFKDLTSHPLFFVCLCIIIPLTLVFSFICLLLIFKKIKHVEKNNGKMREISNYIQRGARVYLSQQGKVLFVILAILFIPVGLTGIQFLEVPFLGFMFTGIIFLIGALSSLLAGYIGMTTATRTNILVVEASMKDPNEGFKLAYYGGMITGILNISLFILGIWIILLLFNGNIYLIVGFSFGASVSSLLAQVGGGIFTKSADMGADLVGKYEMSIKEDDPSNPAIIADLVGDNVGDCAGRGADLFESASSDVIGGMVLGLILFIITGEPIFIIVNFTLIALGMFSLFFTTLFLKVNFNKPSKSIWKVFISSTSLNALILFFLNIVLFGSIGIYLFLASFTGLITVFISILFTIYYTDIHYKHTRKVADASNEGPSINILAGISAGLYSTFWPILIFGVAVVISFQCGYYFGILYHESVMNNHLINIFGENVDYSFYLICFGIWGVSMASSSSDTIISTVLSFDTFGPIMDNAQGLSEMGGEEASEELKYNLNQLDAVGNTTKAISKGFALVCGGFSSIVLFLTFLINVHALAPELNTLIPKETFINIFVNLEIFKPLIIFGLLIGFTGPFLISAMILRAVEEGAKEMVQEVRRQYREIPGLKEGLSKPDYEKCINISAKSALKKLTQPIFTVLLITLSIGILFGPLVVAGYLIGNLAGCLIVGLFFSIGGASFDNAKKGIEAGLYGGKGSFAHKSAIVGDTLGDPLKDSAGPSMNIIITTINTMALTFLPLFMMTGFLWVLFSI
ncbi:MAG: sodium-translocating pyrophosphatase [Promethearchaeota archaeon]